MITATTPEIRGREFRDQMRDSRYPFSDRSTLLSTDGYQLDPAAIIDARFYPPGSTIALALTAIAIAPGAATLEFGDADAPATASATFDPADPPSRVRVVDAAGRPAGLLVLDAIAAAGLQAWPSGTHKFAPGSADVLASLVTPGPESGLRAIVDASGAVLTGLVRLVGDNGVVLALDATAGELAIHAVGDPLFKRRSCLASGSFEAPAVLRTLAGAGPGIRGEYLLVPASFTSDGTALRIEPDGEDGLVISIAGA